MSAVIWWFVSVSEHIMSQLHMPRSEGIPIHTLGLEEDTGCLTVSLYALLRHFPKKN